MKQYTVIRILGRGACRKFILAQKRGGIDNGSFYAKRILDKDFLIKHKRSIDIMNERGALEKVPGSPYLMGLKHAFQTQTQLNFITDCCHGGDLLDFKREKTKLSENAAKFCRAEIILAVQHLDEIWILHQDIKPTILLGFR